MKRVRLKKKAARKRSATSGPKGYRQFAAQEDRVYDYVDKYGWKIFGYRLKPIPHVVLTRPDFLAVWPNGRTEALPPGLVSHYEEELIDHEAFLEAQRLYVSGKLGHSSRKTKKKVSRVKLKPRGTLI